MGRRGRSTPQALTGYERSIATSELGSCAFDDGCWDAGFPPCELLSSASGSRGSCMPTLLSGGAGAGAGAGAYTPAEGAPNPTRTCVMRAALFVSELKPRRSYTRQSSLSCSTVWLRTRQTDAGVV